MAAEAAAGGLLALPGGALGQRLDAARPADLSLIYVEGDSMELDLHAGDIVLLDHTDTRASREGVYVIRMDGALLV